MEKKKKIKLNFLDNTKDESSEKEGYVDDSAEEIRKIRERMMQRREEELNEEDEDGISIKVKPVTFSRVKKLFSSKV